MTDDEARALGERAIEAGIGFRRDIADIPHKWLNRTSRVAAFWRDPVTGILWRVTHNRWWPDLRDAATRGAALDVVRERYPDAYLMPLWADLACTRRAWVVCRESDARAIADGATEAEALVSALESKEPQ